MGELNLLQEKELEILIEKESLNCFQVIPTKEWEKKSLHLNKNTIQELVRFAKGNNIENIFYSYYYCKKEEFIISRDEAIKEIGLERYLLIKELIEKYNDRLENIDYSRATNFLAFCILDDNIFTITEVDNWLEKLNISDKSEKIYEFLDEYQENIEEMEEERFVKSNMLREKFKDKILSDPEFNVLGSRRYIKKYIENLLEQNGMEEYKYEIYIKGGFTGEYVLDEEYIESIWKYSRERKNKE